MTGTVGQAVRWWGRHRRDQDVLIVDQDVTTWGELDMWSGRVARGLADRGIKPGDRVGIVGRNSIEWAVTAIGVVRAGAILLPLNNRFKEREFASVVADMTPSAVFGDEQFGTIIAGLEGPEFIDLAEVLALRVGEPDDFLIRRRPEDPLAIMLTSGSTGRPKGVVYTNASVLAMIFEWSLMEDTVRPGLRTFLPVPFAFAPGTIWGLMRTMVMGGTLVFQGRFDPVDAIRLLQQHRIQVSLGGPIVYEQMARAPEFEKAEFPELRTAITGGARVPVALLETWQKKGLPIRQLYGMSEMGGIATATSAADAAEHPDTCGYGGIFTEVTVVGPDGTPCEPGEPGEILARGPGVMAGYWNDPEQTAAALLEDGWVRGGDIGVFTEQGRLRFIDRSKDLIISGGINISPAEIESVIAQIPGVTEVSVIRASDEKYGEVPAAIVVLNGSTAADVLAECERELADFKVPQYIVARETPLPRLASGKIAKVVVREEYPDVSLTHTRIR
jgi:fatty-acyl-CoA synthase